MFFFAVYISMASFVISSVRNDLWFLKLRLKRFDNNRSGKELRSSLFVSNRILLFDGETLDSLEQLRVSWCATSYVVIELQVSCISIPDGSFIFQFKTGRRTIRRRDLLPPKHMSAISAWGCNKILVPITVSFEKS